jgi:hypothetical protein
MPQLENETMTAIADVIHADNECIRALNQACEAMLNENYTAEIAKDAALSCIRQMRAMMKLLDRMMIEGISLGQYRTKGATDAQG